MSGTKNKKGDKEICIHQIFILVHFYPKATVNCSIIPIKFILKYQSFYMHTTKIMSV